ncbi:hypothetical protein Tco_0766140 [Tanacetum coccineum]
MCPRNHSLGLPTCMPAVWGGHIGYKFGVMAIFPPEVICCISSLVLGDTTLVLQVYKWVAPLVLLGTNRVKVIKEGVINRVIRGYGLGVWAGCGNPGHPNLSSVHVMSSYPFISCLDSWTNEDARDCQEKPKKAKKPVKKSTTVPTTGVVIKDTPGVPVSKKKAPSKGDRGKGMELLSDASLLEAAQVKEALQKTKKDSHMLHASGSGDRVGSQPKVLDESQDKTTSTDCNLCPFCVLNISFLVL